MMWRSVDSCFDTNLHSRLCNALWVSTNQICVEHFIQQLRNGQQSSLGSRMPTSWSLIDENICRRYFHTSNGDKRRTSPTRNDRSEFQCLIPRMQQTFPLVLSLCQRRHSAFFLGQREWESSSLTVFVYVQFQPVPRPKNMIKIQTCTRSYSIHATQNDNRQSSPLWALFLYTSSFLAYFVIGSQLNGCIRSNIPSRLSLYNFVYPCVPLRAYVFVLYSYRTAYYVN